MTTKTITSTAPSRAPSRVLVVENEPTVQTLLRLHLEAAGHDVLVAHDGAMALHVAFAERPDLVLTEMLLPVLDGMQLLAALRANPGTEATPLVFLAGTDEPKVMRRAMAAGADDFLAKPVDGRELVETVPARIARVRAIGESAVRTARETLIPARPPARQASRAERADTTTQRLPTLPEPPAIVTTTNAADVDTRSGRPAPPALPPGRRLTGRESRTGTLMHIAVRNAIAMAHGQNATARRDVLQSFFSRLCEPVLAQFGWVVRHSAHEVIALFDISDDGPPDHAARALRAALLVIVAAHRFRQELRARTTPGPQTDFSLGVALDSGEVDLLMLDGPGGPEYMTTGRLADALAQVDGAVYAAGWSVAASALAVRAAGGEFVLGRETRLVLGPGTDSTTFHEVIGFDKRATADGDIPRFHAVVAEAVRVNSALAETVASAARENADLDPALRPRVPTQPNAALDIPGYTLVRRLGTGGMSRVYLAIQEASGAEHVLKVVPLHEDEELLQRFIQEYALVAQVDHPNVARIFGQGFGANCAYIAMEMLGGGDLRDRIERGIALGDALRYLGHAAEALRAIHAHGIIHRDLKPENLMLRPDGTAAGMLVLADFGIAKQLATSLTKTRHGEVYGTPFYMSPEQARGQTVDGRSDLYSLGVIFHEMLTGAKPFTAGRAEALVYQHLHSDIPTLPGHLWQVQPILDRLLAKEPKDRFACADELLVAIREAAAAIAAPAARPAAVLAAGGC